MNSTNVERGGVGATDTTMENDLAFLESLDNNQNNQYSQTNQPYQSNDINNNNANSVTDSAVNTVTPESYPSQENTLAQHLQEIEKIQEFLAQQAKILGEKVDSSFNTIGNAISTIANELNGFGMLSGESAYQMQRFGNAMENYAALAGTVAQVHSHNKNLNILLETKRQYAQQYLDGVLSFKYRAQRALQGQEDLLLMTTSTPFDSSHFDTPQKIEELAASVKSTEVMYRTTRYSLHMLEYLESEYNAWLNGMHHGQLEFPTMRTATISTLEVINSANPNTNHVQSLKEIFSGSHNGQRIYGRDLLLLSAPHLTAQTILEIGKDNGPTDITNPYALELEPVFESLENKAHPYFQPLIQKNPALNGVKEEAEDVYIYSNLGYRRLKAFFLAALYFGIAYFIAKDQQAQIMQLDTVWQWCLNIVMVLIPIITYSRVSSNIRKKRHRNDFLKRNRLRRHLLCLAGYQFRQEIDTQRKSYTSELVKKAWE